MMKAIRWFVGKLILFFDAVFPPAKIVTRNPDQKSEIDAATQKLALYQFKACPFCVKVRRHCKRLDLNIQTRESKTPGPFRNELEQQGGKIKVPCLRIENESGDVQWMYESNDIIAYLNQRFA